MAEKPKTIITFPDGDLPWKVSQAGPRDLVVPGPASLGQWPLDGFIDTPWMAGHPAMPVAMDRTLLDLLREATRRNGQTVFVYPPGHEALIVRMIRTLNLNDAKVATAEKLDRKSLESGLSHAAEPPWAAAAFQEVRATLRGQVAIVGRVLGQAVGKDLAISADTLPIVRALTETRERVGADDPTKGPGLAITSKPLAGPGQGLGDEATQRLGLFFGGHPEAHRQARQGPRGYGYDFDGNRFRTYAVIAGERSHVLRPAVGLDEWLDVLALARVAEGKGYSVGETIDWLGHLYRMGHIRWPFESIVAQPVPLRRQAGDTKEMALGLQNRGKPIEANADMDPDGLEPPARELLGLVRWGRPGSRFGGIGEGTVSHARVTPGTRQMDTFAAPRGDAAGLCHVRPARLLSILKEREQAGRLPVPEDPSPAALAFDVCSEGLMSIREFEAGMERLRKARCLDESHDSVRLTGNGLRLARLANRLGLCDPARTLALETRLFLATGKIGTLPTAAHASAAKAETEAILEGEFRRVSAAAQGLREDRHALKRLMGPRPSAAPRLAPAPKPRRPKAAKAGPGKA
jgi:hypothetical protein